MSEKKKKSSEEQERKNSYLILAGILLLCVIITIIAVLVQNKSDNKNSTSSSTNSTVATSATETQVNEQVYNSVEDILMDKDTKEATLNIYNDADNAYQLKVTVELDGGEVLYESDMISPGETLGTVTFNTDLTEGEYSVTISVDSYSSSGGELVNGVIYTRTLTVE